MPKVSKYLVLGFIFCAALFGAVVLGAWLFSPRVPSALSDDQVQSVSTVTSQDVDDSRVVELELTVEPSAPLHSASSGLVTDIKVAPGESLVSGSPIFSVDGKKVVALNTDTPLWRTLKDGDSGEDVLALQKELLSLGYSLAVDGEVGAYTLWAVADLLGLTDEEKETFEMIEPSHFMWIPYPSTTVSEITFGVGKAIDPNTELFSVADLVAEAKIAEMPTDLIPGERVLVVGNQYLSVTAEGYLSTPEDLVALQQTPEFQSWANDSDNSQAVSGKFVLKDAAMVYAVAPGAVYNVEDSLACVTDGTESFSVTVVASELGKTLVYFDEATSVPEQVLISPDEERSCR